jgi:hypothetical protein
MRSPHVSFRHRPLSDRVRTLLVVIVGEGDSLIGELWQRVLMFDGRSEPDYQCFQICRRCCWLHNEGSGDHVLQRDHHHRLAYHVPTRKLEDMDR